MKRNLIIATVMLGMTCLVCVAENRPILHEEFGGLLYDHLQLGKPDKTISQAEKLMALTEYGFQPRKGWKERQNLIFGDMSEVLVRVYGIEGKLKKDYLEADAIKLLVDEKVLPKEEKPDLEVEYPFGIEMINKIPIGPDTVPKVILLPRIPVEPEASSVE